MREKRKKVFKYDRYNIVYQTANQKHLIDLILNRLSELEKTNPFYFNIFDNLLHNTPIIITKDNYYHSSFYNSETDQKLGTGKIRILEKHLTYETLIHELCHTLQDFFKASYILESICRPLDRTKPLCEFNKNNEFKADNWKEFAKIIWDSECPDDFTESQWKEWKYSVTDILNTATYGEYAKDFELDSHDKEYYDGSDDLVYMELHSNYMCSLLSNSKCKELYDYVFNEICPKFYEWLQDYVESVNDSYMLNEMIELDD